MAEGDQGHVIHEPFVGIEEAARFLNVKVSWLYEQVDLAKMPSYKVGAVRRFKLSELDAWATARRTGAGAGGDPLSDTQGER